MLDQTTQRLANEALARTVENGGGTFEARTLIPFEPTSGFAVGIGGAVIPAGSFTAEYLAFMARHIASEYEATYVGTWLHEGEVHLDATLYFAADRIKAAVRTARDFGQLAIFDFSAKEAITL